MDRQQPDSTANPIQPSSGDDLERRVHELLNALRDEFLETVTVEYHKSITLQTGETIVPDFYLRLMLPHEESHYLIECQHRKKTSTSLLHKIQYVRSKSRHHTFIFIHGSRITSARRRALESEGVMVYSFSEFAHAFVAFVSESLATHSKTRSANRRSTLADILRRIPHHQHDDYSRRVRHFDTPERDTTPRSYAANDRQIQKLIFHRQYSDVGGSVLPESVGEYGADVIHNETAYNQFLDELGTYFGPGIRVYFSYVMNMNISGYSSRASHGDYLLGISVANVIRFSYAFSYLLSIPDVLPHLGEPGKGQGRPFNLISLLRGGFGRTGSPVRDHTRALAAHLMELFVSDFVFAHELSHVLDGHVDFGADNGCNRFAESGNISSWTDQRIIRVMELLADRQAAIMVTEFPGRGLANRAGICFKLPDQFDEATTWTIWAFSMVVLFYSLASADACLILDGENMHDDPELRVLCVLGYARQSMDQRGSMDQRAACVVGINEGLRYASAALKLVGIDNAMENWQGDRESMSTRLREVTTVVNSADANELRKRSFWRFFRIPK